jgi:hypothetical protein
MLQHLYVGENWYQHVYGNDREVFTHDCQVWARASRLLCAAINEFGVGDL